MGVDTNCTDLESQITSLYQHFNFPIMVAIEPYYVNSNVILLKGCSTCSFHRWTPWPWKHGYRYHFGHASPLSFKDMHVFQFSANGGN